MNLTRYTLYILLVALALTPIRTAAKSPVLAPSYAWTVSQPTGAQVPAEIDTLMLNYYHHSIPSEVSDAYATTGNLGSEGYNLLFFNRPQQSDFFFRDALAAWMPSSQTEKFYNTRIPMTLLSYNFGGGRENAQDRLQTVFSGNINPRAQVGVIADYLYSKGSYNYQNTKDLTWGASGSYLGEKYEFQAYFFHYNMLNKENGGITDELYITDPAQLQGGNSSIIPKTIPTRLTASHSRIVGEYFTMNHRYKLGFHESEYVNDTTEIKHFIPVTTFFWNSTYEGSKHLFKNSSASDEMSFWKNHYLSTSETNDHTDYWTFTNSVGVSLLEGFNKYAKAGLSAYAKFQLRHYGQTPDTITSMAERPEGLTENPFPGIEPKVSQSLLWIGGELTKTKGSILRYNARAEFGMIGPVAGDVSVKGRVDTHIPLFGDTVDLSGYGHFENREAPYLMKNYLSNHFIWQNDFGKTRNLRLGGTLYIPFSKTKLDIGVENAQNHIYFNSDCLPVQHSGSVQIFSAQLVQHLRAGILNWDNRITYQTTSDELVIPLPKLTVYSNLYLLFKVAGVLDVQLGLDCDYYTRYKSVQYQPATMSFYNQTDQLCGNYPFMNFYANMKLSKTRFYIMMTHINQGMTGSNYFSMPNYPLNPRRLQFGISVDFAN
ncbi:MAG: putative porin [Muribaculaceae bacterium]|nr:putative porin [Muribaculaceae bacterium]